MPMALGHYDCPQASTKAKPPQATIHDLPNVPLLGANGYHVASPIYMYISRLPYFHVFDFCSKTTCIGGARILPEYLIDMPFDEF